MMAEAGPEMGPASPRCGGKRIYFSCLFGSDIGEGEENEQVFSIADYVLGAAVPGVWRWPECLCPRTLRDSGNCGGLQ